MPKVKIPKKSPVLDMTPMVDLAFLLVTFFMLTTKFRPDEPVIVDTPSSVSEIKLPTIDIMTMTVDKDGRVFFDMDGKQVREATLIKMGERYHVQFTPEDIKRFAVLSSFGMPVQDLKRWLPLDPEERRKLANPGIPFDSLNNQLSDWINMGRHAAYPKQYRIAIKGDQDADYPTIKRVIAILQDNKINKFNLITSLEQEAAIPGVPAK